MIHRRHGPGQTLFGLALLICAMGTGTHVAATSLNLKPLQFLLNAKHPISAITVRNEGDQPSVVQLEVMKWTQVDGKDVYTATSEVLATPPIVTVAAHGSQMIRAGLRRAADPATELSYRIFLQEVPPPPAPDFKGLNVALRFGVPVFVAPHAASGKQAIAEAPPLQWHVRATPGQLTLNAANAGTVHALLTELTVLSPGRATPLAYYKGPQYVLPGQSRDWIIKLADVPTSGISLRIVTVSGDATAQADVPVDSH